MSDAEIAAQLIDALTVAANREAGAPTALVSATIDIVAPSDTGVTSASLTRKTKTLIFMSADFLSEGGTHIATANSVHRLMR